MGGSGVEGMPDGIAVMDEVSILMVRRAGSLRDMHMNMNTCHDR